MTGDNVWLKYGNAKQEVANCVHLACRPLFFRLTLNSKHSFKSKSFSLVFHRPVEPDTNLFNLVILRIKSGGLKVKNHTKCLIVIIVPLEIAFSGRDKILFLRGCGQIILGLVLCKFFLTIFSVPINRVASFFEEFEKVTVRHRPGCIEKETVTTFH